MFTTKPQSLTKIIESFEPTNNQEQLLILNQVSWECYEKILQSLEDSATVRLAYNQGVLQIMSPSGRHEILKKNIGILLENYCLESNIRFYALGSTTWKNLALGKGIEADQSYCIQSKKELPDLAIEVIITSGGINKLEIYQALGVSEVWLWQSGELKVYRLVAGQYIEQNQSQLFPNLDLDIFSSYVEWDEPFDAVLALKDYLRKNNQRQ